MAFENLIIRKKYAIGGMAIDGIITENTVRTLRMTNHPVEDGNNVADHVILEPLQYTMEGILTDTPMGLAAVTGVIDSVSGLFGQSDSTGQTRSQNMYYELVSLMNDKKLIKVDTSLKTYNNLILETLSVVQDKDRSRSIHFTAVFKQALITVASDKEVDAKNISGVDDKAGLASVSEQGNVPLTNATPSQNTQFGAGFA